MTGIFVGDDTGGGKYHLPGSRGYRCMGCQSAGGISGLPLGRFNQAFIYWREIPLSGDRHGAGGRALFFPRRLPGISPIEGGLVNVAALLKRQASRSVDPTIVGMIDAAARANPKLYLKLKQAVPVPGTQAAVAPVNLNRKPVAWDLIPHVGDAAVMLPPFCGDGMSMALRSARLCTPLADRYLRGEISLSRWEREYTQSIHREFKRPLRWGRRLQWLFDAPVLPRLLPGLAQLLPELASGLVRATRLRETDT